MTLRLAGVTSAVGPWWGLDELQTGHVRVVYPVVSLAFFSFRPYFNNNKFAARLDIEVYAMSAHGLRLVLIAKWI